MEIVVKDERVEQENIHAVPARKRKDVVPSACITNALIGQYT